MSARRMMGELPAPGAEGRVSALGVLLPILLAVLAFALWLFARDGSSAPAPASSAGAGAAQQRAPSGLEPSERELARDAPTAAQPGLAERPSLETGPGVLQLSVLDRESGEPSDSTVSLWRLGLEADELWLAGDEQRGDYETEAGQLVLRELPVGRYRAQLFSARVGSEDGPEFRVGAAPTRVTLWLDQPRERPVSLSLYDHNGNALREATWTGSWRTLGHYTTSSPDWASRRRLRGDHGYDGGGGGRSSGSSSHARWRAIPELDGVYSLPALREDDLRWARTHRARLEVPGLGRTWFRVVGAELEEANHYVAVLLPEEALLPLILLPDGRDGSALDSGVSIDGGCLRLEPGDSAEQAWRDVLIRVRVHSPGYEQVDLEFRAGDGPPLILLVAEGER